MTRPRLALGLLGAGLLAACASDPAALDGPFTGVGFSDGCRTAQEQNASFSTEVYQDEQLFETEASYAAGWRQGYAQCQPQADPTQRPEDLGEREPAFGTF